MAERKANEPLIRVLPSGAGRWSNRQQTPISFGSGSNTQTLGEMLHFISVKFVKTVQMPGAIKYVKDEAGQKKAVLVPVKAWDELNSNDKKLRKKLKAISDIHQALNEVHQAGKSGKKTADIKSFPE